MRRIAARSMLAIALFGLLAALAGCGPAQLSFSPDGKRVELAWMDRNAIEIVTAELDSHRFDVVARYPGHMVRRKGQPEWSGEAPQNMIGSQAAWSPDGRLLACPVANTLNGTARVDLIDVVRHGRRPLTGVKLDSLAFSRDGKILAGLYQRELPKPKRKGQAPSRLLEFREYRVADGRLIARLKVDTDVGELPSAPVWLPGSQTVASIVKKSLVLMDAQRVRTVKDDGDVLSMQLSADKRSLMVVDKSGVRLRIRNLNIATGAFTGEGTTVRVPDLKPDARLEFRHVTYGAVSPDGRSFAFVATFIYPSPDETYHDGEASAAYVVSLKPDARPRLLELSDITPPEKRPKGHEHDVYVGSDEDKMEPTPCWSPKGELVVAGQRLSGSDPKSQVFWEDLHVFAADGTRRHQLPFLSDHLPEYIRTMRRLMGHFP
jgi:hypothetical protein